MHGDIYYEDFLGDRTSSFSVEREREVSDVYMYMFEGKGGRGVTYAGRRLMCFSACPPNRCIGSY
jgi:hypothetical protein